MQSVNLRQLRDTRQIKLWLKAGEVVELRDRDQVLGQIVPQPTQAQPAEFPDAAKRRSMIFGAQTIFSHNPVVTSREDDRA